MDGKISPARGGFPDEARRACHAEIAAAAKDEGLYLHFHNNPWCQPTPAQGRVRYVPGGQGTPNDPGIRWYFEAMRDAKKIRNHSVIPVAASASEWISPWSHAFHSLALAATAE